MASELPRFIALGEALTDLVRTDRDRWHSVAGGSCWNVARVAATLGVPTGWAGAVSSDLFGREIVRLSESAALDVRFIQVVDRPPLIAVVHETNPPQYFFLGEGTADLAFDEALLPAGWMNACAIAHFGCISLVRQPLGDRLVRLAERLSASGTRISFDPNWRNLMPPDYHALVERMCRIADIIKISDEDLKHIYAAEEPSAAIGRIRGLAPAASILYTRGADGMTYYSQRGVIEHRAYLVQEGDSVGAGDACLGGYIASRLLYPDRDDLEHVRFAAAAAAVVCGRTGAYAPSVDEIESLLCKFPT